jgi:hypothetical protein
VVSYTHYMPGDWEGKLHSRRVSTAMVEVAQRDASFTIMPLHRYTAHLGRSSR